MELKHDFRVGVPVDEAWTVLTDVERIAPCMPGAQLTEVEDDEYRGTVKVKVGPITAQYKGVARFVEQDDGARRAVLRAEGRETRGQGNANATITAELWPDGDGTKVSVVTDLAITGKVAQFGRGVMADVSAKLLGQFADCLEAKLAAPGDGDAAAAPGDRVGAASGSDTPAGDVAAPTDGDGAAASSSASPAGAVTHGPTDIASEGWSAMTGIEDAGAQAADSAPAPGAAPAARRRVASPDSEPVDLLDAASTPIAKRLAPAAIGLTVLWLLGVFLRRRRRQ